MQTKLCTYVFLASALFQHSSYLLNLVARDLCSSVLFSVFIGHKAQPISVKHVFRPRNPFQIFYVVVAFISVEMVDIEAPVRSPLKRFDYLTMKVGYPMPPVVVKLHMKIPSVVGGRSQRPVFAMLV
jgi:hypothetical protein